MDWADDIAYAVHDLEDFYRAGLIPLDRLLSDHSERDRFLEGVNARREANGQELISEDAVSNLFDNLLPFVVPNLQPFDGSPSARGYLRILTTHLVGKYVSAAEPRESADGDCLAIPADERAEIEVLKQLTWHYVITNRALVTQQFGQRRVIQKLFEIYRDAAEGDASGYELLPPSISYQLHHLDESSSNAKEERLRLVADAICSFTDNEAIRTFMRLTGTNPGSVLDLV